LKINERKLAIIQLVNIYESENRPLTHKKDKKKRRFSVYPPYTESTALDRHQGRETLYVKGLSKTN
jgi:hypothetical protein